VDIATPSALSKRQQYLRRLGQFKNERQSWDPTYKDIRDFIEPYRGRFQSDSETNRGERKDQNIINCEPGLDVEIQAAGQVAGITNPSSRWFKTSTPYRELNELKSVKMWCAEVTDLMLQAYEKSNIYDSLHTLYGDISPFGTAVLHMDEDDEEIFRAYVFPPGTYYLANSPRLRVDTCFRELRMTVHQLVKEFGLKKSKDGPGVSMQVAAMYAQGNYDAWVNVMHAMQPNGDMQYGQIGARGMKFSSCWLERDAGEEAGFLREGGYEEQPFMAPRWSVVGVDVYGRGPGHRALGDIKALQLVERRELQALEKLVDPPMNMPEHYRDLQVSLRPGAQVYTDGMRPNDGARPALTIDPRAVEYAEARVRAVERRIAKCFHADLWMMLAQVEAGKMTATEAQLRKNEAMLQLGPMLERFHNECLRPMNRRAFNIMMRRGLLPEPPKELLGVELRDEYISILAQAQKAVGIQGIREVTSYALELADAQVKLGQPPTALDKIDVDEAIDQYISMVGAAPSIVRSDEEVQAARQARAQQQAQQAKMQQMQQGADTAKTLSQADTEGDNALTRVLGALGVQGGTNLPS
jgi:hypothetical protein